MKTGYMKAPLRLFSYAYRKPWRSLLFATVAAGTVVHMLPQTASRTLDEHMAAQGLSDLQDHFNQKNIRVYHRSNPLQILHSASFIVKQMPGAIVDTPADTHKHIADLPFGIFLHGHYMLAQSPLSAFAWKLETNTCFVRPPEHAPAEDFIKELSGNMRAHNPALNGHTKEKLADIFYTFVIAHEARHCDQSSDVPKDLRENLSDLHAARSVLEIYGDNAETRQALLLIRHARFLAALGRHPKNEAHHTTHSALARGWTDAATLQKDNATFARFKKVHYEVLERNEDAFAALPDMRAVHRRMIDLLRGPDYAAPELRPHAEELIAAVQSLLNVETVHAAAKPPAPAASRKT